MIKVYWKFAENWQALNKSLPEINKSLPKGRLAARITLGQWPTSLERSKMMTSGCGQRLVFSESYVDVVAGGRYKEGIQEILILISEISRHQGRSKHRSTQRSYYILEYTSCFFKSLNYVYIYIYSVVSIYILHAIRLLVRISSHGKVGEVNEENAYTYFLKTETNNSLEEMQYLDYSNN